MSSAPNSPPLLKGGIVLLNSRHVAGAVDHHGAIQLWIQFYAAWILASDDKERI